MSVSDIGMRKRARFYNDKVKAIVDAKNRKGVVIQAIRGRQWVAVSGDATIKESLTRLRESSHYLGNAPPKIVRDFRMR